MLYSSTRGLTAYDVPLRDSGSPRTSTGAYPVTVDSDYTTVLSITNVTDKQGEFSLQVNYEGGTYELGLVAANPGETKNFDIRKLRDEQTPESLAVPKPLGSLNEQVHADQITVNGNSTSLQGTYIYP